MVHMVIIIHIMTVRHMKGKINHVVIKQVSRLSNNMENAEFVGNMSKHR